MVANAGWKRSTVTTATWILSGIVCPFATISNSLLFMLRCSCCAVHAVPWCFLVGCTMTHSQEAVARKYGWDDVYAGKPIGETWFGKEPLVAVYQTIVALFVGGNVGCLCGIK